MGAAVVVHLAEAAGAQMLVAHWQFPALPSRPPSIHTPWSAPLDGRPWRAGAGPRSLNAPAGGVVLVLAQLRVLAGASAGGRQQAERGRPRPAMHGALVHEGRIRQTSVRS